MTKTIPVSLKIVAWLFIAKGISAAIAILGSLTSSHPGTNLTVIHLFAGVGLLKRRSDWRTYALVVIWLNLIHMLAALDGMLSATVPIDIILFGKTFTPFPKPAALIFWAVIFALLIWAYRVLTRADVKKLFIRKKTAQFSDDSEPVDLKSFQSSWNPYTGSNWFKPGESLNPLPIKKPDTKDR
jgi:hypothetical protein